MTRLRSDSSATEEDELVTNCNNYINNRPTNTQNHTSVEGAIQTGQHNIGSDFEDNSENYLEQSSSPPRNLEQQQIVIEVADRESEYNYSTQGEHLYETEDDNDDDDRSEYYNDHTSSGLLEEAVHQFALSSVRNLTIGHEQDYDLRPNFAILKHKTEHLRPSSGPNDNNNSSSPLSTQVDNSNKRVYPRTPDWFFNIPDTRSPFPDFGSKVTSDDTD